MIAIKPPAVRPLGEEEAGEGRQHGTREGVSHAVQPHLIE